MEGYFLANTQDEVQGRTDVGYYFNDKSRPDSLQEIENAVERGDAYRVEVFSTSKGVHIRLRSNGDKEFSELQDRLEMRSWGLNNFTVQKTGDPDIPSRYEDPNEAIEMYAEYVLDHKIDTGIEIKGIDQIDLID